MEILNGFRTAAIDGILMRQLKISWLTGKNKVVWKQLNDNLSDMAAAKKLHHVCNVCDTMCTERFCMVGGGGSLWCCECTAVNMSESYPAVVMAEAATEEKMEETKIVEE